MGYNDILTLILCGHFLQILFYNVWLLYLIYSGGEAEVAMDDTILLFTRAFKGRLLVLS